MAIGPPDKTYVQIMKERFFRFALICITSLAYLTLFGAVMVPYRNIGIGTAPFAAYFYWRIISKLATGSPFQLSIKVNPQSTEEVFNVIFTVAFGINLVVFGYHLLTWYSTGQ